MYAQPFLERQVQKTYKVKINQSFVLSISSCPSDSVCPGPNRLDDVGGSGKIQKREFPVRTMLSVHGFSVSVHGFSIVGS